MSCQVIYKEPCIYETKPTAGDAEALQKQVEDLRSLLDSLLLANSDERERLLARYSQNGTTASTTSTLEQPTQPLKRSLADVTEVPEKPLSHSPDDDVAAAMLSELSVAASGQVEHFGVTSFLHRPALIAQPSPPVHLESPGGSTGSELLRTRDVPPDLRQHLFDL
ncbi:hypothetical protein JCM6882_001152 [Rhodosporidiobolus microsporus]